MPEAATAPATSPATAPATSTATPTSGAPAPSSSGGFLDHIKLPDSSPADAKVDSKTDGNTTANANTTTDAKPGTTPAPAPDKPATPPAPAFKATIRGREYSGEDLVKAFEHSSAEGLRLNDSVKQAIARANAAEAKLMEMEAKLEATPPFAVLSKEQLAELTPAEQTEYVLKKNAWETQQEARKEKLARTQEAQKLQESETKEYIYSRTQQMYESATEYPGYRELMPVMEQILDRVPSLGGMKETPDILYYAALGLQKHNEGKVAKSAEEKAKAEAAAKAAADAAAAGSGNPPAPVNPAPEDDDSDEAFNKRLLAKAPGRLFH